MKDTDVFVVAREEHHLLKTCPCDLCVGERKRRSSVQSMSPGMAHAMGIIPRRSPGGSVARRLMNQG